MKDHGGLMAQSVKHLILDFSSGHELVICEIEPLFGLCTDNFEPAWDSLSLSLSLPLPCSLSRSLSQGINKHLKKWRHQKEHGNE